MRLPVQDRRTQSLRPIATPSQGQPGVSGLSMAGQALTEAAKLADQGQKIQSHFETIRLQNMLNEYDARVEAEWSGTDDAPGLQQMRGLSAVGDEKGGFRARLKRLEEFRNEQLSQLPAHLQRKYNLMLADRVRRTEGKFRTYALEEARKAGNETTKVAEQNAVDAAAQLESFDAVEQLIQPLDWIVDEATGERSPGSSRATLMLNGAPDEVIQHHFNRLRADAHMNSIVGKITSARDLRSIDLIDAAKDHLEQAKDLLTPENYDKLKKRIETERVIVAAEGEFERLLTISVRDSADRDARWVDEAVLANNVNEIEDPIVRSAVWKLVRESAPLRERAKKQVVEQYGSAALKTFWDTRSITAAVNSEAMRWLERNDPKEWNRVREQMETWASRWRREARANESLDLRRQRQADQDPENIRNFWYLQEDMLMNPHKYAAEDYTIDSLRSEWGGRIPGGLHDRMFSALDKHKRRMQTEGYRLAQEHFRRAVNARRDRFEDAQKRREFVGVMYELYDQEIAPDQRPTIEDIEKIIARADTRVLRRRWWILPDQEMTYAEALTGGFEVYQHQDPETGEWVDGPPPPGMSEDANVRAGGVAASDAPQAAPGTPQAAPSDPGAPPPDVDPDLWRRAREAVDPADRNNPAVIREAMEILAGG